MGVKQIMANRARKKLRFAVLRPKNQSLVAPSLDRIKSLEGKFSPDEFQHAIHDTLRDGAIFVGFLKPGCRLLFNGLGFPIGGSLQPGDVLDEIEEFRKACEAGVYQLEARDQAIVDGQSPQ